MKKINKYLYIILLLATFLILFIMYFILNSNRNLTIIESKIKDIVLLTEEVINVPISFTQDKIEQFIESKNMYKKLKEQDEKIKKYNLLKQTLLEKNKRIEELEKLLDLKNDLSDYEIINASVINRNINSFYEKITIDKGKKDGIKKDMAVISKNGLIGKIKYVEDNTSTVELITKVNSEFQISVTIEQDNESIHGLLSDFNKNNLIVNGISDVTELKKGSKVITTGFDSKFPSGILVGYVEKTEKDKFELSKKVYVKPSSSFDNIRYVSILKRRSV